MKIRIKDEPVVCGGSVAADKYRKALMAIAGRVVDVETEYLFRDQFNIGPVPGFSEDGLRVMANDVTEVIDDLRPAYFTLREL